MRNVKFKIHFTTFFSSWLTDVCAFWHVGHTQFCRYLFLNVQMVNF